MKASAAAAEARALQEAKASRRDFQKERRRNFDAAFATNDVVDPSIKLKLDRSRGPSIYTGEIIHGRRGRYPQEFYSETPLGSEGC